MVEVYKLSAVLEGYPAAPCTAHLVGGQGVDGGGIGMPQMVVVKCVEIGADSGLRVHIRLA